jgi:hypothetical protein
VHLLDAVEDHAADESAGRFNRCVRPAPRPPAPGGSPTSWSGGRRRPGEAVLVDRALVDVLLGRELRSAVHRVLPEPAPEPAAVTVPAQRSGLLALLLAVLLSPAVFIGGSWGGGGWGPRRRRRYGGPRPIVRLPAARAVVRLPPGRSVLRSAARLQLLRQPGLQRLLLRQLLRQRLSGGRKTGRHLPSALPPSPSQHFDRGALVRAERRPRSRPWPAVR